MNILMFREDAEYDGVFEPQEGGAAEEIACGAPSLALIAKKPCYEQYLCGFPHCARTKYSPGKGPRLMNNNGRSVGTRIFRYC